MEVESQTIYLTDDYTEWRYKGIIWGHSIKAIISVLHTEDQGSIPCGSTS